MSSKDRYNMDEARLAVGEIKVGPTRENVAQENNALHSSKSSTGAVKYMPSIFEEQNRVDLSTPIAIQE